MQITPRRRAVIIGYQKLNLSFSTIAAAVNVPRSTASTIYYNAVKSARADALLAGINEELEQLQLDDRGLEAAGEDAVRDRAVRERAEEHGREGATGDEAAGEGAIGDGMGEGAVREECGQEEVVHVKLSVAGEEPSLLDLLAASNLDSRRRSGRPQALSEAEKDHLVATVKRDFRTRRMFLVDLRREAGLSHVCNTTVWSALRERGIRAYREQFKFILTTENKKIRLVCVP